MSGTARSSLDVSSVHRRQLRAPLEDFAVNQDRDCVHHHDGTKPIARAHRPDIQRGSRYDSASMPNRRSPLSTYRVVSGPPTRSRSAREGRFSQSPGTDTANEPARIAVVSRRPTSAPASLSAR